MKLPYKLMLASCLALEFLKIHATLDGNYVAIGFYTGIQVYWLLCVKRRLDTQSRLEALEQFLSGQQSTKIQDAINSRTFR